MDSFFKAVIITYTVFRTYILTIFVCCNSGYTISKGIYIKINSRIEIIFIKSPTFYSDTIGSTFCNTFNFI